MNTDCDNLDRESDIAVRRGDHWKAGITSATVTIKAGTIEAGRAATSEDNNEVDQES